MLSIFLNIVNARQMVLYISTKLVFERRIQFCSEFYCGHRPYWEIFLFFPKSLFNDIQLMLRCIFCLHLDKFICFYLDIKFSARTHTQDNTSMKKREMLNGFYRTIQMVLILFSANFLDSTMKTNRNVEYCW